jgi:hypothetical protein
LELDLSELKTDPKYGVYPWWPEDGDAWVHPEDVGLARSVLPSPRVWRREGEQGPFVVLHYGAVKLRVKRTLWLEVAPEGFDVGDLVEVLSRGMANEPRTGAIRDMHWDAGERVIRYFVEEAGTPVPNGYVAGDLRHVEPAVPREEVVIEPAAGSDAAPEARKP